MPFYGGVEAGGTKFICIVGTDPQNIVAEKRIPTTTPEETLANVVQFFREQSKSTRLDGVGIGCFGPVDLDVHSPTYGYITTTPKPGWQNTDIAGTIQKALDTSVAFDTDVNAAAYGEWIWGAAQGLDQFIYLTIGTGIGGGILSEGRLLHGLIHPEMGHIRLPHDWTADPFPGICPFHGDCFEGMCSGPSMGAHWGIPAEQLPEDHLAWSLEAEYIAQALSNLVCSISPQRFVLGGGVMQQSSLFPHIRRRVQELLNGYVKSPAILKHIDEYIVSPGLGSQAGVLGSLALVARPN